MARSQQKLPVSKSLPTSPMTDDEIEAFLTEIKEAQRYRDDLEIVRLDLSPTELVVRMTNLPLARQRAKELENRLKELRGDALPATPVPAVTATSSAVKPNGRMRIQAEAYEYWIRLKASGANPTVHSISEPMAKWCADNNITTHTGVTPRAGTIRNTILGGSSGWQPPRHSRDQAKDYVAQLAQVA